MIQEEEYGGAQSKLRTVLDRRAEALMARDEAGYLADLDPGNRELLARERMIFANLAKFEFAEIRYVLASVSELPDSSGGTAFNPVIRIMKLTADAGPGDLAPGEAFQYHLAERGGKTLITDVVPANEQTRARVGISGPPADAPWHTEPLKVIKVGSSVWLAADESVRDLNRYADVTGQEYETVRKLWGSRPSFPGYVLFFTRTPKNFQKWYNFGTADVYNPQVGGFQQGLLGVSKDGVLNQGQYVASRIVVNLASSLFRGEDPARVIRHELVHGVTARAALVDTGFLTLPTWAVEGFARYVETIDDRAHANRVLASATAFARTGRFRNAMPANDTFYAGNNYELSSTVFSLAERLNGREAAVELFASAIQRVDTGGRLMEMPVFDDIAKQIFGMSGESFRKRWIDYVRSGR